MMRTSLSAVRRGAPGDLATSPGGRPADNPGGRPTILSLRVAIVRCSAQSLEPYAI